MDYMARCKTCGQPCALAAIVDTDNGPSACTDPCHSPAWQAVGKGRKTLSAEPDPKSTRIDFLERRRKAVIADMMIKAEGEDWHGVQDCASDLRDTDNELDGLRF